MTTWRADPSLQGKFHPQYADDIEVIVHDGEPRRTKRTPEGCWVRVNAQAGALRIPQAPPGTQPPVPAASVQWSERPIYSGTLLNKPHGLTTVREGSTVQFVFAPGLPHPLMITPEYQRERPGWLFVPCNGCGADQGLDPPTTMARTRFPDAPGGSIPIAFTAFCPCGGTMMLTMLDLPRGPAAAAPPGDKKPWWKFW